MLEWGQSQSCNTEPSRVQPEKIKPLMHKLYVFPGTVTTWKQSTCPAGKSLLGRWWTIHLMEYIERGTQNKLEAIQC